MADIIDFATRLKQAGQSVTTPPAPPPGASNCPEVLEVVRVLILVLDGAIPDPDGRHALACWAALWNAFNQYDNEDMPFNIDVPPQVAELIKHMPRQEFAMWLDE